jgi:hypothetical protein
MSDDAIRTVEVRPPSASGETRLVVRVAAMIVFGALFVIGMRTGAPDGEPRPAETVASQVLFRDVAPPVQRLFRELQEGLVEAEQTRAATTQWPAVETLAAQNIPPFAAATPIYRWRVVRDGLDVAYVGTPLPGSGAPAFLAHIREAAAGSVETATTTSGDDPPHRLADGTLLAVSIWFRSDGIVPDGDLAITRPFATGWTRILAATNAS